jgi:Protein of unknown function (DUF1552)
MPLSRRRLLRNASSLGAAGFLAPALAQFRAEAEGVNDDRPLLLVLTFGNGWGHQGMSRAGTTLDTTVRSKTDWDLPTNLSPLLPHKNRLSIIRNLKNPFGKTLHGSGWSTLSVMPTDGRTPGGISIDRLVARETAKDSAFPSLALGISVKPGKPAVSASADGFGRPYPAFASPVDAFNRLFGAAGGSSLQAEQSLLDAAASDVRALRSTLGPSERQKLEQLVESYDAVQGQTLARAKIIAERGVPAKPTVGVSVGLDKALIRSHFEVAATAMAYGLTRVVHLSLLGFDAHNAGWDSLGFPGDAHEMVAHMQNVPAGFSTETYNAVVKFQAQELATFLSRLGQVSPFGRPLSDRLTVLWLNAGGGKHHDGGNTHPCVVLGPTSGPLQMGRYVDLPVNQKSISEAFLAISKACGAKIDVFGSPDHCKEPLSELL